MANKILILGQSGTGKSTSIECLDEKETYIIQITKKNLPFRGWKNRYRREAINDEKANVVVLADAKSIIGYMQNISDKAPHIKTIIVDDLQYLMSFEFIRRASEKSYDKFTDMAVNLTNVLRFPDTLRDDLSVVFTSHIEKNDRGEEKMKTVGKLVDEKIVPEGLFDVVLKSNCSDGEYFFETQNNGLNTIHSPKGMLEEKEPNDLKVILEKIELYNN